MAAKIKKGDTVIVLTGKDKGKTGTVLQIFPTENRALVQGINMVRKHQKQTANQDSGIISKEAAIQISNLAMLDPKENKPTRVGFTIIDGVKRRVAKLSGEVIDV